jgi:hypothetical protein
MYLMKAIEAKFSVREIEYLFYETETLEDVFKVLQSLDIYGHSAFIIVGTDQSFNAGINGMLARADGLKLPVGLIPVSP